MRHKKLSITIILGAVAIAGVGGIWMGYQRFSNPDLVDQTSNSAKNSESSENNNEINNIKQGEWVNTSENKVELKMKDGSILVLQGENRCGGTAEEPKPVWEQCYEYRYENYLEEVNLYVIEKRYHEWGEYVLVNDRNGEKSYIGGIPQLSPLKNRIAVVNASEGFGFNGIEIWNLQSGKPVLEWRYEPSAYALYEFVDWKEEDVINMKVGTFVNGKFTQDIPAKLLRLPQWHIEGPQEKSGQGS